MKNPSPKQTIPMDSSEYNRVLTNRPDTLNKPIPKLITTKEIRELTKLYPFISSRQIFFEWVSIFSVIWLCHYYWHPIIYIFTIIWIGSRMHGIAVLMHEGVHYRLAHNKMLNDLISELILAWPIFLTMRSFRSNHFKHHRSPNSIDDPDWVRKREKDWEFPKSKTELVWMLFQDLIGLSIPKRLIQAKIYIQENSSKRNILYSSSRIGFYLVAILIVSYFQLWSAVFLYWIVPFATWLNMTAHLRSIADHFAIEHNDNFIGKTRTTILSTFEKLFLAPNNINYHIEHHLYPSVPFYNLPKLHQKLMENPKFRKNAHITKSYIGLFKECLGETPIEKRV